jgi:hypothetical protein
MDLQVTSQYSPLYKIVISLDCSYGEGPGAVVGAEMTPELQALLANLDSIYTTYMDQKVQELQIRLENFRQQELKQLQSLDQSSITARDCLFAAIYRAKQHSIHVGSTGSSSMELTGLSGLRGTDGEVANALPLLPSAATVTSALQDLQSTQPNNNDPHFRGASPAATKIASTITSPGQHALIGSYVSPSTTATKTNLSDVFGKGHLPSNLALSYQPSSQIERTVSQALNANDLVLASPKVMESKTSSHARPQKPKHEGKSMSSNRQVSRMDDENLFQLDDDGTSPMVPSKFSGDPGSPISSEIPSMDIQDDGDTSNDDQPDLALRMYATSVPMPIHSSLSSRQKQSANGSKSPIPEEEYSDGASDRSEPTVPPHEYLAKTYHAQYGEFYVGSKPPGEQRKYTPRF